MVSTAGFRRPILFAFLASAMISTPFLIASQSTLTPTTISHSYKNKPVKWIHIPYRQLDSVVRPVDPSMPDKFASNLLAACVQKALSSNYSIAVWYSDENKCVLYNAKLSSEYHSYSLNVTEPEFTDEYEINDGLRIRSSGKYTDTKQCDLIQNHHNNKYYSDTNTDRTWQECLHFQPNPHAHILLQVTATLFDIANWVTFKGAQIHPAFIRVDKYRIDSIGKCAHLAAEIGRNAAVWLSRTHVCRLYDMPLNHIHVVTFYHKIKSRNKGYIPFARGFSSFAKLIGHVKISNARSLHDQPHLPDCDYIQEKSKVRSCMQFDRQDVSAFTLLKKVWVS